MNEFRWTIKTAGRDDMESEFTFPTVAAAVAQARSECGSPTGDCMRGDSVIVVTTEIPFPGDPVFGAVQITEGYSGSYFEGKAHAVRAATVTTKPGRTPWGKAYCGRSVAVQNTPWRPDGDPSQTCQACVKKCPTSTV